MEELSPKEIMIGVIVVLLTFGLANFFNTPIRDAFVDDIRNYQTALQVDGDSNQFQYAKTTSVGDVFAFGRMNSVHLIRLPELIGDYGLVEKVTEEYTRHTRQVCDHHDDDGDCTSYRTEVYYTWDTEDRFTWASDYYEFLSVTFLYTDTNLEPAYRLELGQNTVSSNLLELVDDNCIYEDTGWVSEGDQRFYYRVLPVEFNASMFVTFNVDSPTKASIYYERTREQVLMDKEQEIRNFNFMYYLCWLMTLVGGYFWWAHAHGDIE